MAGVENPETVQKLDGKSFVKLVTDGSRLAKEAVEKGKIRNQKEANAFVIPEKVSGLDPERSVISHMPHQWAAHFRIKSISFICKSETYFCMKMEVVKPICLYMILST